MSAANKCSNCRKDIDQIGNTLQCDNCSGFLHHYCADVALDELQRFTRSRAKGFRFICKNCASEKPKADINLKDIRDLLTSLKRTIEDINIRLSNLETQYTSSSALSDEVFENVVSETIDRLNRATNVVVIGVPENINANIVSNDIVSTLCGSETNITVSKAYRLGKITAKPRPIKIELPSKRDAIYILKNKDKLKKTAFKDYIVRGDCTKREINYLKKLRGELTERVQKGEADLTIKYIRGVPKIIQRNNSNT